MFVKQNKTTMNYKRMEFDTREWSDEKRTALINKLKSEGYRNGYPNDTDTGKMSIATYEHGTYNLYDEAQSNPTYLTTYEEYMGELTNDPKPLRQVVLKQPVSDIVSVDDVLNSKFYGAIEDNIRKMLFYQVDGRYTFSDFKGLLQGKILISDSLTDIITHVLKLGIPVYEFDTSKELLEWLNK
jgi:hypothetical protein